MRLKVDRIVDRELSDLSEKSISAFQKKKTRDGTTDRPSYRDAWTHLKNQKNEPLRLKIALERSEPWIKLEGKSRSLT